MHLHSILHVSANASKAICELDDPRSNVTRFWLFVVFGGCAAIFGMVANALLAWIFISNFNFRHSPSFFMGFVAFFDSLLDFSYLLTMTVPAIATYFECSALYIQWLLNAKVLMLLVQIFKIASVFCLIIACYERYILSKVCFFSYINEAANSI